MSLKPESPLFFEFADFRVDGEKRLLWRGDEKIQLTPKVFDLLLAFLEHRGEVLEKDFLMNLLWADSFVEESNLAQNVAVLRKALGENPKQHKFILTVPGRGYRFVAEVTEKDESIGQELQITDDKLKIHSSENIPAIKNQKSKVKNLFIAAALILVALGGLVLWYFAFRAAPEITFEIKSNAQLTTWTGLEFYPAISADGNTIAFSSDNTGNFEIYVKQLVSGAKELQITADEGQNFQPAFSPDGGQIVYHSKKRGGIWIVPATGGTPKRLTEFGSSPSFSPDGKTVVFQQDPLNDLGSYARSAIPPSTLWTVLVGGGEPQQLTKVGNPIGGHGSPSFSPDGKFVIFTSNDTITSDVWTISLSDGNLTKTVPNSADGIFAPDGKSIFAVSRRNLVRINLSSDGKPSGEPYSTFISSGSRIRHLAISRNTNRMVYSSLSMNSNIWSIPLKDETAGTPVQYTQSVESRFIQPTFSPDGKKIAFQALNSTGELMETWLMDADGKNQNQIAQSRAINPRWFPDGKTLGYFSRRDGKFAYYTLTVEGALEKKLFDINQDATQARMSPDGKRVAFNSKQNETLNIWTMPLNGGEPKQITFDKEAALFPMWSPDGKWIAFQAKRGDDSQIFIMPDTGGEPVQITNQKGHHWNNDWSPDSRRILYAGQREGLWNLFTVAIDTKEIKQLTDYKNLNSYVRSPSWSPLNNQIVYEYAETTGNVWMIELK